MIRLCGSGEGSDLVPRIFDELPNDIDLHNIGWAQLINSRYNTKRNEFMMNAKFFPVFEIEDEEFANFLMLSGKYSTCPDDLNVHPFIKEACAQILVSRPEIRIKSWLE
jgi:hypothetical protein